MKISGRNSKKPSQLMILPILLMAAFGTSAFAATLPRFSATVGGTPARLTLYANINVADADVGKTGNDYIGLNYGQTWLFHNGAEWVMFDGGALPIYATAPLANRAIRVINNANVTSLNGGKIVVGYGLTENDMRENNKFGMVYTLGSDIPAASSAQPQTPIFLGTAGNFAILTKTGITDVSTSAITGNIGSSPITGAAIGVPCSEMAAGMTIYSVDAAGPACEKVDPVSLTAAVSAMEAAYTDAFGRTRGTGANSNLGGGNLSNLTLTAGTYTWDSNVTIPTDITLSGNANDVFIFQISGTLDIAANQPVILYGGVLAKNIFWQVADVVTLGAGSHFEGIILAQTKIAMQTGATINGRLLAQSAVTLQMNTVTQPAQ